MINLITKIYEEGFNPFIASMMPQTIKTHENGEELKKIFSTFHEECKKNLKLTSKNIPIYKILGTVRDKIVLRMRDKVIVYLTNLVDSFTQLPITDNVFYLSQSSMSVVNKDKFTVLITHVFNIAHKTGPKDSYTTITNFIRFCENEVIVMSRYLPYNLFDNEYYKILASKYQ
jgi:hypothetical protein